MRSDNQKFSLKNKELDENLIKTNNKLKSNEENWIKK
jgi:hypothetical protein